MWPSTCGNDKTKGGRNISRLNEDNIKNRKKLKELKSEMKTTNKAK